MAGCSTEPGLGKARECQEEEPLPPRRAEYKARTASSSTEAVPSPKAVEPPDEKLVGEEGAGTGAAGASGTEGGGTGP